MREFYFMVYLVLLVYSDMFTLIFFSFAGDDSDLYSSRLNSVEGNDGLVK